MIHQLKAGIWLFKAWSAGFIQVPLLGLATIWFLMWPPVFERYYPLVKESNHAADAASIVHWIAGNENVFGLNPGLQSGQLKRKELKHYADVRRWMHRVPEAIGTLVCGWALLVVISNRRTQLIQAAQWRGLVLLSILLGFAALLAVWDWEVFFAWVHYPFFGATSWRLSRSSYSLQLFPNEFWQLMGMLVVIVPGLVMAVTGMILRYWTPSIRSAGSAERAISGGASVASGQ